MKYAMNLDAMSEAAKLQLLVSLGGSTEGLPPAPDPRISHAADALDKAAPPPPLSLGSKVGLGLLTAAAATPLIYAGYRHYYPANDAEAEDMPKAASLRLDPTEVLAARTPQAPSPVASAWARYGF